MYDDWEMVRCCFLCVCLCGWWESVVSQTIHLTVCVCVCAVGAVVWVEKGKHVIMVIIVKNITGEFISCERWNERTHEEQREIERKGRESESWNGMEMVLTSTKINASLTAFVRQWFFNCFSLPLPPTTTNGYDDEWTNNDDDDFICLQFTLWKMKMSVLTAHVFSPIKQTSSRTYLHS